MSNVYGSVLVRGPMATDNFTQVHNDAARGQVIHTKYVGVWCYLCSHREGWRLTELQICRDLGVGRDFVRSALANIEQAGCLIRSQQRDEGGTYGAATWFVTDLPFQLRALGITDPVEVKTRVRQQYEEWRSRRSEPMSEKPTSVKPTTVDPTPKKTKSQKTKDQNTNQPARRPSSRPANRSDRHGPKDGRSGEKPPTTSTPGEGEQLLASLPLNQPLPKSMIRKRSPQVDELLRSGWTARELTAMWTANLPDSYGPGLLAVRIEDTRPKRSATPAGNSRPDWCGECDEACRQVEDPDTGAPRRCPTCHPLVVRARGYVDLLAGKPDDSGAVQAAQILGLEWRPPNQRDHDRAAYMLDVLPAAARQFVEDHRSELVHCLVADPRWRSEAVA